MTLMIESGSGGGREFRTTHWSVVVRAGGASSAEADAALERLCRHYWHPLYAYVRGRGHDAHEAEDLVQGFFARVLEQGFIAQADASRGRFRSFLLGCLNHYLSNEWRRGRRQKRGSGVPFISLQDGEVESRLEGELAIQSMPEAMFDRLWAVALLDRVLSRLRAECEGDSHRGRFEVLQPFLTGGRGDLPLADAAQGLGMSLAAVKSAVHRLRQRYRELVREEIAQTVDGPGEVEEELRHLFAVLGGGA